MEAFLSRPQVAASRHIAASAKCRKKCTLTGDTGPSWTIINDTQVPKHALVIGSTLNTECSLSDCWHHSVNRNGVNVIPLNSQPLQPSHGKDRSSELPTIHLPDSSLDVASNVGDTHIGPYIEQLKPPPQRATANDISRAESINGSTNDGIPGILSLREGAQYESIRVVGGQIFEGMHCKVDAAIPQCRF